MNILTDTQKAMKKKTRAFVETVLFPDGTMGKETVEQVYDWFRVCGRHGLIGVGFPKEYGGLGFGYRENVIVAEELARVSCSLAGSIFSQLHCANILLEKANEEQKRKYLVPALTGERILALGLTEESADSNLVGMSTTARRSGEGWILNGFKRWVSNAGKAQTYVVAAHIEGQRSRRGLNLFIVDANTPGLKVEMIKQKMGLNGAAHGNVTLDNCYVSDLDLIPNSGEGFSWSQVGLNFTRLNFSAASVGVAQCALDLAVKYAKQRKILGHSIANYQGISFALAEMETTVRAMRSMLYDVAATADADGLTRRDAATLKCFTSMWSSKVCDQAQQIFGANGYNAEYGVERCVRDSRVLQAASGTVEMCKIAISNEIIYK